MADYSLAARPRTVLGKRVARLRRAGVTPANIYGRALDSVAIEADERDLTHLLRRAGRTHLIQLTIEGERAARPVLVRDVSRKATNDLLLHVEFQQVSMLEKLTVEVPVVMVGTSPAAEDDSMVLSQQQSTVLVECLPGDIPQQIDADISSLIDTTTTLFVRDLTAPPNTVILTDGDLPLVSVTAVISAAEEDEAEAAEAAEAAAEAGETPAEAEAEAEASTEGDEE